jgi:hypothetical protein
VGCDKREVRHKRTSVDHHVMHAQEILLAGHLIQLDALTYDSPSLLGSHNPVEPKQIWYGVWEAVGTWRPRGLQGREDCERVGRSSPLGTWSP